jgi:hypothetical protein
MENLDVYEYIIYNDKDILDKGAILAHSSCNALIKIGQQHPDLNPEEVHCIVRPF